VTVKDFFRSEYVPLRLLGRSPDTVDQYVYAINRLNKHLRRPATLADLTDRTVGQLCQSMLERGRSPATVNSELRHLEAVWRFAHQRYPLEVPSLPNLSFAPTLKRKPRAWSPEEVGRILASCDLEKGYIGPVLARDFWRALTLLIYDIGCRIKVLMKLQPADVDLVRREVSLPAHWQKDREEMALDISAETAEAVERIYLPNGDRLLPWPFDRSARTRYETLRNRFKRILRRAGLDLNHKIFQRLRRTHATQVELIAPGHATARLGHSSRKVTVESYIDPRFLPQVRIAEKLPRPR
jgi:integrase